MLRLIGFLVAAAVAVGGFMAIDYSMAKRWASSQDGDGLTFGEYLSGFSERLTGVGAGVSGASGLPVEIAAMMPAPPDGWTVRPAVPEDVEGLLPKGTDDTAEAVAAYVTAVAQPRTGDGLDQVVLTYEKGGRRVIFQAVRYPNLIFTSFMAMQQRTELQMLGAQFRPTPFMTVRGLDVTEDLLPEGTRARYFLANVGAQIQIRVVASRRISDEDLVPFFQTLHVKAMNASVVDKRDGLGDVPVIVLASVLNKATRAAYEADRDARAAEDAARQAADRIAAEAQQAETGADPAAPAGDAATGGTRLQGEGRLEMNSSGGDGVTGCDERAGTKFCGTAAADPVVE